MNKNSFWPIMIKSFNYNCVFTSVNMSFLVMILLAIIQVSLWLRINGSRIVCMCVLKYLEKIVINPHVLWSTYWLLSIMGVQKAYMAVPKLRVLVCSFFSQVGCLHLSPHNDTHVKRQCDMAAKRVISATRLLEFETWLYSFIKVT